MDIQTKFNRDDIVLTMINNKIYKCKIVDITIKYSDHLLIIYTSMIVGNIPPNMSAGNLIITREESEMFSSKEELIKSYE